ncbi:MAG: alpha/beta fold hydrolase [Pseudomonadota bacterium]
MGKDQSRQPDLQFVNVGLQKLRTAIWHGDGHGRPLLFFNGIGANLEIAQPLGESLTDRDIITFDLPGIGGSPNPTVPYRPWWVAHAAKTILRHFGYDETVDVMGVSWGGGAAQQFAFQYKKTTNRLVLVATAPGVTMVPGDVAALSKMAHPMRYTSQEFLVQHFEALYGDERLGAHQFAEHMKPPQLQGYLYQLSAMAGWSSLPFLPFLPHETLVLAGGNDKIVPLANARMLKFFIRKSELEIFDDGGHLFLLSHSKQVLPILRGFLDREAEEEEYPAFAAQPAE